MRIQAKSQKKMAKFIFVTDSDSDSEEELARPLSPPPEYEAPVQAAEPQCWERAGETGHVHEVE
jgi:hypothetical protein